MFDSPERRAALDRDLRAVIGRIGDPSIRRPLRRGDQAPAAGAVRPAPRARGGGPGRAGRRPAPGATRRRRRRLPATKIVAAGRGVPARSRSVLREAVILATLITHPDAGRAVRERAGTHRHGRPPTTATLQRLLLRHAA